MGIATEVEWEARRTARWQQRLLPFMMGAIAVIGVFFFVASLVQLYYLHSQVGHAGLDLRPVFAVFESTQAGQRAAADADYLRWKTSALLEQDVIARRYHQVNSAMLARVWTRYLGFVTGMILALVGAVFILGKLREEATKLEAEGQGLKASLATSSPGIVLAVLGTGLMAITLVVPFEIATRDRATYLGAGTPELAVLPKPPVFEDVEGRERELFGAPPAATQTPPAGGAPGAQKVERGAGARGAGR